MKLMNATLKVLGGAMIYAVARALSGIVWPLSPGFSAVPENEAWFTIPALLLVGLVYSLILRFYAKNSSAPTGRLILKASGSFFLINTIQTQVETFYFRKAFPLITDSDMAGLFVIGILFSILFAPACILLHRAGEKAGDRVPAERDYSFSRSWWRYALAALAYVPLYLGFGMLAKLSPVLREEYASWIINDRLVSLLPLWQVARGTLFAAIAVLIFSIFPSRNKAILGASLSFALFTSLELLFPNILMPPTLRLIHFFEITASMVAYAFVSGYLLLIKLSGNR